MSECKEHCWHLRTKLAEEKHGRFIPFSPNMSVTIATPQYLPDGYQCCWCGQEKENS